MSGYPMWHIRFVNARNKLGEASMEMEQAFFEDENNAKFKCLYERIRKLLGVVDVQLQRNFKRGRKEGWGTDK